jgi:hypothetical protein
MVEASIGVLNVADKALTVDTPLASLAGTVEVTVGGVGGTTVAAVVKLHL